MPKKKIAKTAAAKPAVDSLLVELLTEELPPKSLKRLSEAFAKGVADGLKEKHLLSDSSKSEPFATPRRLAVRVSDVLAKQADRIVERKGPSLQSGLDTTGQPTQALVGFARSCATEVSKLARRKDDKGEYFVFSAERKGEPLANFLPIVIEDALKKLPVAKLMRWGSGETQFVRPVHGFIALHGAKVVPGMVLGIQSGNKTLGHRFLSKGVLVIKHANDYEKTLDEKGKVVANFATRRLRIKNELSRIEGELAGEIARTNDRVPIVRPVVVDTERSDPPAHIFPHTPDREAVDRALACSGGSALLDEVNALVEWPRAYWGRFDDRFREIPVECLALTMKQNQKYFPVFSTSANLLSYFVVIGNNDDSIVEKRTKQVVHNNIVSGNERVLRPRLADARFFLEQDSKVRLDARVPQFANVVYQSKLGSQLERIKRLQLLAGQIAHDLNANVDFAKRAALLAKTDLLTNMVEEFPELQGTMGRHYALHDNEPQIVADAIEAHYRPRFAGDQLPEGLVACSVALADKLDTLVGIFSVGLVPTGEKDPFGLRRAAVGVLRILMEKSLSLNLMVLLERTGALFPGVVSADISMSLFGFFKDRLSPYLRERGYTADEIDAVLAVNPALLNQILPRLDAVKKFRVLPEGKALAAANKRIRNILRHAETSGVVQVVQSNDRIELRRAGQEGLSLNRALLREAAEQKLGAELQSADLGVMPMLNEGDFDSALKRLAALRPAVDEFFDKVMVMVDDASLRDNRLALLKDLANLFLRIADVSRLQG